MNRIYQGRVSRAELLDEKGNVASPLEWDGCGALWDHHVLFQDAVNYYTVCLLAMAQPGNPLWATREKLNAEGEDDLMVWRPFRRRGVTRSGMRDSVAKYFTPEDVHPTPMDCFSAALSGNECATTEEGRKILDEGLMQILRACTGAAGCKQSAPVFLPRLTSPDYKGSYAGDTTTLARESERERLPFVLYAPDTTPESSALDAFGVHSIALPNEKKPKFYGAEAISKLRAMIAEWRERQPDSREDWARLEATVGALPESFEIPGYAATSAKNEVKFRLFAMFFFRHVERSEFTLGLLRATTRKPETGALVPEARVLEAGTSDPIRRARGERGFVFRAFTSLSCWGGNAGGRPQWVEFDFAAFEEALKALHQVEAKKKVRDDARKLKEAQHDYQRARSRKWKVAGDCEGEGVRPPILEGDPRIERLTEVVDVDLREEYEMSEGVSVKYGLHPRTIRGFRDLQKKWSEKAKSAPYSAKLSATLLDELRSFQKDNPNIVGSVGLFEELLKEANWIIWREPSAEQEAAWRAAAKLPEGGEFARDPLQALTDERELLEEIERLKGPIRFTPADAVHSRRQFYFSDVTALDKKGRLRHDRQTLETEVAVKHGAKWERKWVRMEFNAPRLLRDQLNNEGGREAAWQQAMMAALGVSTGLLKNGRKASFADCAAVALMPELDELGALRILLNFPLTLDGEAIAKQIGRAERWDTLQFGGTHKKSYWLRWRKTWIDEKKERKKAPPAPWWRSDMPFRVLSVDLGQRDAGAYALLEASPGKAPKKESRKLGTAEGREWWATVRATGMLRLPGEDAMVLRQGKLQEEFSGKRGRMATDAEWLEAREICEALGLKANDILGEDPQRYSFPEMNDRLLFALRRAQSRLARLQSWSCIAHSETKPKRREKIVAQIEEVEEDPLNLKALVEAHQWPVLTETLRVAIEAVRAGIRRELVRIANRIQPLRGRDWEWVPRPNDARNFHLRQTEHGTGDNKKWLAGQRGLSLKRIEQLEGLRQRCQSLNRAMRQEPGQPAKLGRDKRGIELPDPCPELLERLEALKEQRVNQTAHLILAQALGVRLCAHTTDAATRAVTDIHGEYERIPGREPVDFLVLEDLDHYLASQGRGRSENSRLMKWSHRQILGKLKQLCEPYGLRVLETAAAYSSKFCSLTGVAGFRAVELNPDSRNEFPWKKHLDRLADPERAAKLSREEREESQSVKQLFDELDRLNGDLLKKRPARPKWRTFLAPQQLGPLFVPMVGKPMQADINAAINLGLRAIASPEADDIHVRIRAKHDGNRFVVRAENEREKARWGSNPPEIVVPDEASRKKLLTEAHVNFFTDTGRIATFDRAEIVGFPLPLVSGRGLWGMVNQFNWRRCEEINSRDDVPM